MDRIIEALSAQKILLEGLGHKVAYICLQGSQNYGLDLYTDTYRSDIDMKAIIVPTLDDLIKNSKPISKTVDTEWGQCDLKDIRVYFETLVKAHPTFLETLFTKYYIVDEDFKGEFDKIFALREDLVYCLRFQFIRRIYGMMCDKEKQMYHPTPAIAEKIEKYGYDGKNAHHIQRLWLLMQDYFEGTLPLSICFYPEWKEVSFLRKLKLNELSLEFVQGYIESVLTQAKEFKDNVLSVFAKTDVDENKLDYSIKNQLLELSQTITRNKIIKEVGGANN